jgi:hypothetical protein
MLFAIDESKVAELTKTSASPYTATIAGIVPNIENPTPYYGSASGSAIFDPSVNLSTSRSHLLNIRRRIEESGTPLKSPADLSSEIEAMRSGRE